MDLRLDLAREYAKTHLDKKINKKELAKAMFPESKHPYLALYALETGGRTKKVSIEQIEAIIRLTGIPLNMLIS